jgi:DNA-directed RNA polymerase specialized sigma24 family protein
MLDIDTIKQLPDLTANTLYHAEVAHLPKRSRAEVEALIERARQGDKEAREAFILSCLSHALGVAYFVYHERCPSHDDMLDLVQVASLRMVEKLDHALATSAPAAYLRGIARRVIMDYCTYHAELIQKPEYARAVLEKMNPHPATVVSLDTPSSDNGKCVRVDLMQAKEPEVEPDEKQQQKRWAVLHEEIRREPLPQQTALVRLYGLFGQPAEATGDIGRPGLIRNRAYAARKKLRAVLSEYLEDRPDEEQE